MTASALSDRLATLLGPRFSQAGPPHVRVLETRDHHGWLLDDLSFDFAGETAPAWFLRPPSGRVPAVLYAHAHGNNYALGRDELIAGRGSLQGAFGADLVAQCRVEGVVLIPSAIGCLQKGARARLPAKTGVPGDPVQLVVVVVAIARAIDVADAAQRGEAAQEATLDDMPAHSQQWSFMVKK